MRWGRVCVMAALAVTAVGAFGCGGQAASNKADKTGPGASAVVTSAPSGPSSPAEPTGGPGTTPATMRIKVYLCLGEKVQSVERTVPASTAVLAASLKALLQGPTAAEKDAGLLTTIPEGTSLRGVSLSSGVATVDLTGSYGSGGGTLSMLNRLAQVVYTVTQFPSVKSVRFKLDGKPVTVLGGEGIIISAPQTRADYEYSTPAILLDDPAWGATVKTPVVLRGTANVFEAVFNYEVVDPNGTVKATGIVHASSGTGTRGTFMVSVPFSLGAAGTGRIRLFTLSAKDGTTRENLVEVPVGMTH